jgi:DTW domain-containing protein YfiP
MTLPAGAEPRTVCLRCRRPASVCYCAHIQPLQTATRVVLLQHPRERDVPVGTAHMAALCLPGAELHVGVRWGGSPALNRALSDPARPAALLYPGLGAIDVVQHPPPSPVTLVVIDGTWSQTRKVLRDNPELAALPRYAFTPSAPSEYRIRREPAEACVSTIEALALVLGALEGDPARFQALLRPFRAMVEAQIAFARDVNHGRKRPARPRRPRVPAWVGARAADLVCVVAEANAWPYRDEALRTEHRDELVHAVACRLSTGETFEEVLAPRNPLCPSTADHLELSPEVLGRGGAVPAFVERWRAFVRDTDVVCSWGHVTPGLIAAAGGHLPPTRIDVRQLARNASGGRVGTLEEHSARLDIPPPAPLGLGRGGARLARVAEIMRRLAALAG